MNIGTLCRSKLLRRRYRLWAAFTARALPAHPPLPYQPSVLNHVLPILWQEISPDTHQFFDEDWRDTLSAQLIDLCWQRHYRARQQFIHARAQSLRDA